MTLRSANAGWKENRREAQPPVICAESDVSSVAWLRAVAGLHRYGYARAENPHGFAANWYVCGARCSVLRDGGWQRGFAVVAEGRQRELRGWRGEGPDMKAIARSLVVILVALIAVPALGGVGHAHDRRTATGHDGVDHGRHPALAVDPTDTDQFITRLHEPGGQELHRPGYRRAPNPGSPWSTPCRYPAILSRPRLRRHSTTRLLTGRNNLAAGVSGAAALQPWRRRSPPATDGPLHRVRLLAERRSRFAGQGVTSSTTQAMRLDGHRFLPDLEPMRPNGGILGRGFEGLTIPIIGITFYGPTENSCPTGSVFAQR